MAVGLMKIKTEHSHIIKEVRILGLICGLEFHENNYALKIFNTLMKKSLITTIVQGNTIRITPPLTVSKKEIKEGLKIIASSLSL